MPTAKTKASALLQKASSQLKGERIPIKQSEENELQNYLNSIQQKTQQVRSVNFEDDGDISVSSGGEHLDTRDRYRSLSPKHVIPQPTSSKFLKKKSDKTPSQIEENLHQKGNKLKEENRFASSALSKATSLETKFGKHTKNGKKYRRQLSQASESEENLSVGRRSRSGSVDANFSKDGHEYKRERSLSRNSSADKSHSSQIKKKHSQERNKKKDKKVQGEIERTLGKVYLTSEEESLADFIQGLSVSEASRKPKNLVSQKSQKWRKKSPTPGEKGSQSPIHLSRSPSPFKRSPSPFGRLSHSVSQDSDLVDSIASEINDNSRRRKRNSLTTEKIFDVNLMDVASLLPATESQPNSKSKSKRENSSSHFKAPDKKQTSKKARESRKRNSKPDLLETMGIHMVDDLLQAEIPEDRKSNASEESEIPTERSDLKEGKLSESEIITELVSRKAPLKRQSSFHESISEQFGDSSSYGTATVYSDTFESQSESEFVREESVSEASKHKGKSHSKRSSITESYKRGKGQREKKVVVERKSVEIAAAGDDGKTHVWTTQDTGVTVTVPLGLKYVDPAPIARNVISSDAIEALTAYSPNVLALQEMMKAQLELVSSFVEIQKRIYDSCMAGLREDYHYTTLEDTKQYIKEHRKPRLSFKEAIKLVEAEESGQI